MVVTPFQAEITALLKGLELAFTKNLFPLILETDCQVLSLLIQPSMNNASYTNLIHDCRFLIAAMDHPPVGHIYREANSVANVLANYGSTWIPNETTEREDLFWAAVPFTKTFRKLHR